MFKVDDFIKFKGKNPANSKGRIIELADNGVKIVNMNMPFMGDHSLSNPLFVPFKDIIIDTKD